MGSLEKIGQLEEQLRIHGIDSLLVLSREDSDSVLPLLLPVHVVAQTAIWFRADGAHVVLTGSTDANMYREFGIFEIIVCKDDFQTELARLFERLDPKSLALNISETDHLVDGLTVGQYQLLEDAVGADRLSRLERSSEPMVSHIRSIKTDYELQCIRTAVEKTCAIYDEVVDNIAVGMSETEIGDLFVEGMRRHHVVNAFGSPYSYPLVCIVRCGLAHREPNPNNVLKPNDILVCDFSVSHKGYCSDIARSFYVLGSGDGEVPHDVARAFETTVQAVSAVIDGIQVNMTGCEVDALGRVIIEEAGYPTIRHSVGHQLGMRVHDGGLVLGPASHPSSSGKVQVGQVFAIEPTVIQDDQLPSFIVEEDIVVHEGSVEILSRRQQSLYLIRS
jgi:Xaa-Pro aminopeptidase